ncbi:MAG: IreB family regulatory phosphoprotein [Clostridiales bacterium]|nr:IreB family regulatory phosphoprotein [Clostridiales bacterium]
MTVIASQLQRRRVSVERNTILFNSSEKGEQKTTEEILKAVHEALEEKGYNAIDQMVGYILSGDPSYITGHNNARNLIRHIERDDLVEELLRAFLKK